MVVDLIDPHGLHLSDAHIFSFTVAWGAKRVIGVKNLQNVP